METQTNDYKATFYSEMVAKLFKKLPESKYGSLMHAAVGMSGESVELANASGRKNILEEAGDFEFYLEAAEQQMGEDFQYELTFDGREDKLTVGNVFRNILSLSGDFLDFSKKCWVYGKDPSYSELFSIMAMLRMNLDFLYELLGTNYVQVLEMNKKKLIGPGGRFEAGFYTDAAAIARADKIEDSNVSGAAVPGSERSFIGKK